MFDGFFDLWIFSHFYKAQKHSRKYWIQSSYCVDLRAGVPLYLKTPAESK